MYVVIYKKSFNKNDIVETHTKVEIVCLWNYVLENFKIYLFQLAQFLKNI